MTLINYVQANLIPVTVIAVVYADLNKRLTHSKNNRLLGDMLILLISVLIADTIAWAYNGIPGNSARVVLWISNMVYFALIVLLPYQWMVYATRRLRGGYGRHPVKTQLLYAIPLIAYIVMLAFTPVSGMVFTIDENNVYNRGYFILFQQIISFGYIAVTTVMALIYAKHSQSAEKKHECLIMAGFTVPTLLLSAAQAAMFGTALIWQGTALSAVLLYFNIIRCQVALDGMTGLNNRRSLDEYLLKRVEPGFAERGDLYVMLMDINDFKSINDTYGHVEGDKVICSVAMLLKYYFSKTDAFISRYGGDEFAVAINCSDGDTIKRIVEKIHSPVAAQRHDMPWTLRISVGVARYDYSAPVTPEQLLKIADDNMYIDKQITKKLTGDAI